MLAITNTAVQTLAAGATMVLPVKLIGSGTCECHRTNTNSIKMREHGKYEIGFSGNIGTVAEGDAQIAIAVGGVILPETTMISATIAAGDLNNVSKTTFVNNCCGDFDRITVVNTGTAAINVGANPILYARRIS